MASKYNYYHLDYKVILIDFNAGKIERILFGGKVVTTYIYLTTDHQDIVNSLEDWFVLIPLISTCRDLTCHQDIQSSSTQYISVRYVARSFTTGIIAMTYLDIPQWINWNLIFIGVYPLSIFFMLQIVYTIMLWSYISSTLMPIIS